MSSNIYLTTQLQRSRLTDDRATDGIHPVGVEARDPVFAAVLSACNFGISYLPQRSMTVFFVPGFRHRNVHRLEDS
jgi:hypothetical protein